MRCRRDWDRVWGRISRNATRRLREAVTLMRRLWSEDRVTFDGQYYKTREATIYDRPAEDGSAVHRGRRARRWRSTLAALPRDSSARAGRCEELYRDPLPALVEGVAGPGAIPEQIDRMIEVKVSFDTDRAAGNGGYAQLGGACALVGREERRRGSGMQMERLADALPTERTASTGSSFQRDPDEHVERIKFYTDLGFNHLVFHAPGNDQARFIDLYSREIPAATASPIRRAGRNRAGAHDLTRGHRARRACP